MLFYANAYCFIVYIHGIDSCKTELGLLLLLNLKSLKRRVQFPPFLTLRKKIHPFLFLSFQCFWGVFPLALNHLMDGKIPFSVFWDFSLVCSLIERVITLHDYSCECLILYLFCSGFSHRGHDGCICRPSNRERVLPWGCNWSHFWSCFLYRGLWIISFSLAIWWIGNLESPVHGTSLNIYVSQLYVLSCSLISACLDVPLFTNGCSIHHPIHFFLLHYHS